MLRLRIADHAPLFVVCYGAGNDTQGRSYLEHWRKLAGVDLVVGAAKVVGRTVFFLEQHPSAHGTTNEHWFGVGHKLRASVASITNA